jgi:hypothetical protein
MNRNSRAGRVTVKFRRLAEKSIDVVETKGSVHGLLLVDFDVLLLQGRRGRVGRKGVVAATLLRALKAIKGPVGVPKGLKVNGNVEVEVGIKGVDLLASPKD